MPIGGFTGRNLQGISRVLQAFGATGCFEYLLTEFYDITVGTPVNTYQNAVCVYDDKIYFLPITYRNSTDFQPGSLYLNSIPIGGIVGPSVNIGDYEDLPTTLAPLFDAINISSSDYLSVGRCVVVDNFGFYLFCVQQTPTQTYVQFATLNLDLTYKTDSGQTTYDASASDAERFPESMSAYDGNLYTISSNGYVYVYDFDTLTEQDSWTVTNGTSANNHSISVYDDKVYVFQTKSSGDVSTRYCKCYVYELNGTYIEDFEILRHYPGSSTTVYGNHESFFVGNNVIYSTHTGGFQQQHTISGTHICSSVVNSTNDLDGMIQWKDGTRIYLDNGKVITP